MKRIFISLVLLVALCALVLFWWVGRSERLHAVETLRGTGTFPETVTGLPIFRNAGAVVVQAAHNSCQKNPVSYCADVEDRRYFSPDRTGRWGFRVLTAKLVSGDLSAVEQDIVSRRSTMTIGGNQVYFEGNSVSWFTDAGNADIITIVLMPLTGPNGTVGSGEVTAADVYSNSDFISTFLTLFPPKK